MGVPDIRIMEQQLQSMRQQIRALQQKTVSDSQMAAIQTIMNAKIATPRQVRIAAPTLPLVAVGTYDQAITWSSPMPADTYTVDIAAGSGVLGRATCAVKAGTQVAAGLTVTVTAALVVSAGSQIIVLACG
jgi:hypothetical protein